jgi:hypothetical protein
VSFANEMKGTAMNPTTTILAALLLAPLGLLPNSSAAEPKAQYAWPFTTENGLFHLWLPEDASAIKGLLVFPYHGTGEQWSKSPEVQELAKELGCGIVAFDQLGQLPDGTQLGFPGTAKSPDSRLLDALAELAKQSGHMEMVNAPLCLFGHSNATMFVSGFGGKHPERVFAWIAFKSAFGKQFSEPAIYPIPGLVLSGENDASYFQDQLTTVKKLRKENHARVHMIVEPGGGHWGEGPRGTKTLPIVLAFIRTTYHIRVPADADLSKGPPELIDAAEEKGWLGKNLDGVRVRDEKFQWSWETPVVVGQLLEIAPYSQFTGDKREASWLPTEEYARKWQEFCHTGMLTNP